MATGISAGLLFLRLTSPLAVQPQGLRGEDSHRTLSVSLAQEGQPSTDAGLLGHWAGCLSLPTSPSLWLFVVVHSVLSCLAHTGGV